MDDATAILKRQSAMETDRMNFDAMWQDVAQHLLPRQADFLDLSGIRPQGQKRSSKIFDSTAMLAMDRGIAVCEGYSMPKGTRWQVLAPRDEELGKLRHVREWYQRKTAQLFQLRTMPFSGFDTQAHESWASLLAFGNQATWIEVRRDKMGRPLGLFYRSEHIGTLWVAEDAWGRVDTMHRRFTLTARQAAQRWPHEIPPSAAKALKGPTPDPERKSDYLEVIEPNARYEKGRMDWLGKPWAHCHVDIAAKAIFDRGGYRSMPRVYSRYEKAPFETYGRGPGMSVLPDVKQCQQMVRDIVTACEFMGRPALLAADDDLDGLIQYFAGGVTYGGLDADGNPKLRPMFEGIDISGAREMLIETRQRIQQAFFNDLFLVQQSDGGLKSHVSAAAIMERAQEKGLLLSPLGRQETEWFGPGTDRELDLMGEIGLLDDMPGEVREAGGSYQSQYENPLARARRAEEAGGFYQLLQGVTPLIQAKPQLIDDFLTIYDFRKIVSGLAWVHSAPAAWETDEAEREAKDQAVAGQAQAAQLLEAAPVVADVADKLSRAGASNVLPV